MASIHTNIETLGEIHKSYNKRVLDAIKTGKTNGKEFTSDKNDLDNLMKIDIASNNKDIDYIIGVLKCNDMLYISRALHQCPWLADDQYAHIMNPRYLQEELFPLMMTKARIKLLKHLRQYVKNKQRAEEFYNNETEFKPATKWLSRCSVSFIENNIQKHMNWRVLFQYKKKKSRYNGNFQKKLIIFRLTPKDFKRFCEISVTIFEKAIENESYVDVELLKAASFLLTSNAKVYLNAVENKLPKDSNFKFSGKATELIMKQYPERVLEKPEVYLPIVDVLTLAQNLNQDKIKDFINKHAGKSYLTYDIASQFIRRLPKEEQFGTVKKLFLDGNLDNADDKDEPKADTPPYLWYTLAPFDIAFDEIKKLIDLETTISVKHLMFLELVSIAKRDMDHLRKLLVYHNDNFLKDDEELKSKIINKLLSETAIHKYDDSTWCELNKIIASEIGSEKKTTINNDCIKIIIIYNVLRNNTVPQAIKQEFSFDTLINIKNRLDTKERQLIFNFLYEFSINKLENVEIDDEASFKEAIKIVSNVFDLLMDWDKNITDYPIVLEKVKYLMKMKKENYFKASLSPLYNKNKHWRKYLFEESLLLNPGQNTGINALKHGPYLLDKYKNVIKTLRVNDNVSIKLLLRKLRVYYPDSLADNWINENMELLNNFVGHKALIRGLFTLLTQEPLSELIKKYSPQDEDWRKTEDHLLSLQVNIARNLHHSRPQLNHDLALLYANINFVKFSLPSILAILYNSNKFESQELVIHLITFPEFVEKYGLNFVLQNVEHEKLKEVLTSNKNMSGIKVIIFEKIINMINGEKDKLKIKQLSDLLEHIIGTLTFEEGDKMYEKILLVKLLPLKLKPPIITKSYNFMKGLFIHTQNENYLVIIGELLSETENVIQSLRHNFIEGIIEEHYFEANKCFDVIPNVMLAYIKVPKKDDAKIKRLETVVYPIIEQTLERWDDGDIFQNRFKKLFSGLTEDLRKHLLESIYGQNIKDKIDGKDSSPVPDDYRLVTIRKLRKRIEDLNDQFKSNDSTALWKKTMPEFGRRALEYLKEDVQRYSPLIYKSFAFAVQSSIDLKENEFGGNLMAYREMLGDENCVPAYLAVIQLLPSFYYRGNERLLTEIKEKILSHSSAEVQIHFHYKYRNRYRY